MSIENYADIRIRLLTEENQQLQRKVTKGEELIRAFAGALQDTLNDEATEEDKASYRIMINIVKTTLGDVL